jgi:hypothetical protein
VYSVAAYAILNVDVNTISDKIRSEPKEAEKPKENNTRSFVPRTKGFVNAWR